MDNQKLAELLFPDVTKTPEYYDCLLYTSDAADD